MEGMKVVITEDSPHSGYGYYEEGNTGMLVGFTQGCAVVILDCNSKFVKVGLDKLKKIEDWV